MEGDSIRKSALQFHPVHGGGYPHGDPHPRTGATGRVEFSFCTDRRKLSVPPQMEKGEVVTKPEYLVMLSSLGLLGSIMLMLVLGPTRCQFFAWFQRRLGMRQVLKQATAHASARPIAVTAFMETVVIIWTFYIVLLLAYDPDIAGDRHPVTYFIAFGSLAWSAFLFAKLMRAKVFDHATGCAIPTVIILWNFAEVVRRGNLSEETCVHPVDHWGENTVIPGILTVAALLYVLDGRSLHGSRVRVATAGGVPLPIKGRRSRGRVGNDLVGCRELHRCSPMNRSRTQRRPPPGSQPHSGPFGMTRFTPSLLPERLA